ncbi:hypothetical protein TSUD_49400 [Trifolium subterraneum]|uniref:Uncharacterized protein n=1 Tax=Trifolium subterraneum TaxID=3900 RepID=A0A2Z6LXQ0_TRISU|nr:hypothetical protein TSUD_49400 [Trifolium subterraneum]
MYITARNSKRLVVLDHLHLYAQGIDEDFQQTSIVKFQTPSLISTFLNQETSTDSTPSIFDPSSSDDDVTDKAPVEDKIATNPDSSFLTDLHVITTPSLSLSVATKKDFTVTGYPCIASYMLLQHALQVFDQMSTKHLKPTSLNQQQATMKASILVMVRQLKVLSSHSLKCFDPGGSLSLSLLSKCFLLFLILLRILLFRACLFSPIRSQTCLTITEFQTMQSSLGQASGWPK